MRHPATFSGSPVLEKIGLGMDAKQSNDKRILHLDGWRGLAILLVLVAHFTPGRYSWLGLFGVALFFALSGVLMSDLLFVKLVSIRSFFIRRASRVLPTFWLACGTFYVYTCYFQTAAEVVPLRELGSALIFLRTYLPAGSDIWLANWPIGHFWSLNVEEHAYVFLACGAVLCRSIGSKLLPVAFLIAAASLSVCLNAAHFISLPGDPTHWFLRSEYAAAGLLTAAAYHVYKQMSYRTPQVAPVLPALSFVLAAACFALYAHRGFDRTIGSICRVRPLIDVPLRTVT
jgi:peptidoglycan/LPS O-acetylase OafA/YrhL